jgi:ABC-type lipoprotein export system ATPase subunit
MPLSPGLRDQIAHAYEHDYKRNADALLTDVRAAIHEHDAVQQNPGHLADRAAKREKPISISVRGLSKEYKLDKKSPLVHAVNDVTIDVHETEIVALTGASGSGKSTLMHLIGGLDTPTTGEITVFGQPLHSMKERQLSQYRNSTIGFIFQFFYLQPYLSVLKNVEVPLMFRNVSRAEREQAAREAVRAVGLEDRAEHLPNQLSGGQMQRVAIARALVTKPRVILADEPTGNLDQATGKEIMELLKGINRDFGTTIVLVTHDPNIARHADRVVTLSDGRIISHV